MPFCVMTTVRLSGFALLPGMSATGPAASIRSESPSCGTRKGSVLDTVSLNRAGLKESALVIESSEEVPFLIRMSALPVSDDFWTGSENVTYIVSGPELRRSTTCALMISGPTLSITAKGLADSGTPGLLLGLL